MRILYLLSLLALVGVLQAQRYDNGYRYDDRPLNHRHHHRHDHYHHFYYDGRPYGYTPAGAAVAGAGDVAAESVYAAGDVAATGVEAAEDVTVGAADAAGNVVGAVLGY